MARRQDAAVEHLVRPRWWHERHEPLGELLGRQLERRRAVGPGALERDANPVAREGLDPVQREWWGSERRQPRSPEPEVSCEPAQALVVARPDEHARVQAVALGRGAQRRQRELLSPEPLNPSRLGRHGRPAKAEILTIESTGTTINGVRLVRVHLRVPNADGDLYEATTSVLESVLGGVGPGSVVPIRIDPDNPSGVIIEAP